MSFAEIVILVIRHTGNPDLKATLETPFSQRTYKEEITRDTRVTDLSSDTDETEKSSNDKALVNPLLNLLPLILP